MRAVFLLCTLLMSLTLYSQEKEWQITADNIDPNNYYGITVANGMVGLVSSPNPMQIKDIVLNLHSSISFPVPLFAAAVQIATFIAVSVWGRSCVTVSAVAAEGGQSLCNTNRFCFDGMCRAGTHFKTSHKIVISRIVVMRSCVRTKSKQIYTVSIKYF